jgi:hypothetical protein
VYKYIRQEYEKKYYENPNINVLWVGSVLNDYLNLDDREATQAVKYRFGYKLN